jgi:2-dehydro-3-deoxyphosphogluconate aldolase/(4S)-4-hydroxy-2-oxoglutarate aldolase
MIQPAPDPAAVDDVLAAAPVMAVVTIERAADAVPLAQALMAGGLPLIEVTLRTAAALEAVRAIRAAVPAMRVGVGTVLSAGDLNAAIAAGASFAVSPGATASLLKAAAEGPIPFLPGTATASEVMAGLELGFTRFKFFPAEQVGGAAALKSLAGPLARVRFCPTGGITPALAPTYLSLPNVACVGGSWVAPNDLIATGNWAEITARAAAARALRP